MSLSLSQIKLFNDLVLLSKNHYGERHCNRAGALRLLQIWTGTNHSRYHHAFEVYFGIYTQTKAFKNIGYTRMTNMVCRMVIGDHHLWQEPDSVLRAVEVLLASLATTHRDDFCFEDGQFPAVDRTIQTALDEMYASEVEIGVKRT